MMSFGSFVGQFLLAVLVLAAAVYLPGRLLVRALALKPDPLEHLAASLVAGVCALTLVYWGLLAAGAAALLWVLVGPAAGAELVLASREHRLRVVVESPDEIRPEPLRAWWPLGLVVLAGMAAQGWFMVGSAWPGPKGMMFYAWHAHDAVWHVYNLFQLSRTFPPETPGFAGETLRNYHLFSDLFWGAVLRLAPAVDRWHAYFRIAPFLYSGLLSLTMFTAARAWSGRKRTAYAAVVLTVFLTSFGYLLPLLRGVDKYFIWDSIFWVQSPLGNIFNPGVSSSYGLMLLGLWALTRWLSGRRPGHLLLLALVWGVLPGFKVYPALLVMAALLATGAVRLALNRDTGLLAAFAAVLPVFLLVFLPSNLHAPSLIRLLPGFNLAAMLVSPDRLGVMTSGSLKLLYATRPALTALLLALLVPVFILGNLGVRSLGLIPMVRALVKPRAADPVLLFLTILSGGALAASLLFVQSGVHWNTIQFFYYAVLVAALPAAQQFWAWSDTLPPWGKYVWAALFLALGLPCTFQSWYRMDWGYYLSRAQCDAYRWLQTEADPGARILRPLPEALQSEDGFAQWQRYQERGRMTSLQAWSREAAAFKAGGAAVSGTTATAAGATLTAVAAPAPQKIQPLGWGDDAFVAALTGHNTFLEDTVSAQIMGYPVDERAQAARRFYAAAGVMEARDLLESNHIAYVLLDTGRTLPFDPAGVPLKKVFANSAVTIYKYLGPGW